MAGITTHVLDTANGRPASGVGVTLAILHDNEWRELAHGATDNEGRLPTLTEGIALRRGTYRLTFATGEYNQGFFPEVSIVFRVDDPAQHYHVPLLLSPFGYSTYRGS
ncbi:MAG TPA: hydroxyisourate hydrolase [Thermoanaerobaculia bacterium]|nr:hydroxyisourate hydrolase [Thermoanaerobaculia bacterium]